MKKHLTTLVILSSLSLPVLAETYLPLHQQAAKYSWHWDTNEAGNTANKQKAQNVQSKNRSNKQLNKKTTTDYGTNNLGW